MSGELTTNHDCGPVGGGVAVARTGNPPVVETNEAHGLADGDRVRISTATGSALCYVKASGQSANAFSVYKDSGMTQPAEFTGAVAGDVVERLNAEDWAIVAGRPVARAPTIVRSAAERSSSTSSRPPSGSSFTT